MKLISVILFTLTLSFYTFSQLKIDTLNVTKTYFLKLTSEFTIDTVNTDTSFFHIHRYDEWFQNMGINLNNGVCAFYSFRQEYVYQNPFWLRSLDVYYQPLSQRYFHTRVPFTQIRLIANTNRTYNEEIVKIVHTQNVNKKWNIGFEGISNKSIGKIPRQDNRFHYLMGSTNYQGSRYYLWANYYYSKLKAKENGGVQNPSFLTDSLFPPENAMIFLQHANNNYVVSNLTLQQWYKVNKSDTTNQNYTPWIIHQSSLLRAKKIFTDSPLDTFYYNNTFIDSTKTYDSLFYQLHNHSIGLAISQNPIKGNGLMIMARHLQRNTYSYLFPLNENAITANISFWVRKTKYSAKVIFDFGVFGYLQNLLNIDIRYNKKISRNILWQNKLSYEKKEPDIFENNFYSNHYRWTKSFPFKKKIHLESSLKKENNKISLWITNVDNFVIFNNIQEPTLIPNFINAGMDLNKLFNWKNFYSYNKLLLQYINDTNIQIPNAVFYSSLYYQNKLFKDVLTIQFGADVWCHSKYKPVGYSPVLNNFYTTNNDAVGLYPVVSLFLNASLKRARFFVKMEHLNYQWQKANFFLIHNYPLSPRMLKFGIFWNFYD
jgi:hypothetical protein